jgi:hypothetical protein
LPISQLGDFFELANIRHIIFLFFILLILSAISTAQVVGSDCSQNPARHYILDKLKDHRVVFLGTTHKQPAILGMIAGLLPHLDSIGVTHLGLEIGSDQQVIIDEFFTGRVGVNRIALADAIDSPAYRHLLEVIRKVPQDRRPMIKALDLPSELYGPDADRDRWLAMGLADILMSCGSSRIYDPSCRNNKLSQAKVLVILGNMHVLRRLCWNPGVRRGGPSIRTFLDQWQSDLSMFSIINIMSWSDRMINGCDFTRRFDPRPCPRAMDLDQRFRGWKLGIIQYAALEPAEPWDLADGIIVH